MNWVSSILAIKCSVPSVKTEQTIGIFGIWSSVSGIFSVLRIDIEFSKYRIFFLCFGIPTQDYIAPLLTNSGSVSADYDILEYQLV